jgi:hypothetical protein
MNPPGERMSLVSQSAKRLRPEMILVIACALSCAEARGGSGDRERDSTYQNRNLALSISLGYGSMQAKEGIAGDLAILYGVHSLELGLSFMGASQINTSAFASDSGPRREDNLFCLSALAGVWPFGRGRLVEVDGGFGWYWETQWQGTWEERDKSGIGVAVVARILGSVGKGRLGGTFAYFATFESSYLMMLSLTAQFDLSSWR